MVWNINWTPSGSALLTRLQGERCLPGSGCLPAHAVAFKITSLNGARASAVMLSSHFQLIGLTSIDGQKVWPYIRWYIHIMHTPPALVRALVQAPTVPPAVLPPTRARARARALFRPASRFARARALAGSPPLGSSWCYHTSAFAP